MPSDRTPSQAELDAAFNAYCEWSGQGPRGPASRDAIKAVLSAAATARPDWESVAQELYMAVERYQRPIDGHGQFCGCAICYAARQAMSAFELASLGEGEGGRLSPAEREQFEAIKEAERSGRKPPPAAKSERRLEAVDGSGEAEPS